MKKIIDVKNELKAPQASIRTSGPKLKDPHSEIFGIPLTCESSRQALKELIDDIRFVSGKTVTPLIAFEALLHYWKFQTSQNSRLEVAINVDAARRFAYKRRMQEQTKIDKEYEVIADRLLNALNKPQAADEVVPSV